jgi:PiT family inorganic phosphate transporter
MTLVLIVVLVALVFEYINGFHDTANSIATVVSTKVLTPRLAIILAALTNLVGALWGTAVAKTISSGLVESAYVTTAVIVCALFGGIVWNLLTWLLGLPSSSSHAMIGGLCGATLASAKSFVPAGHSIWSALIWAKPKEGLPWFKGDGLLYKVVIPMITSPVLGFLLGLTIMTLLYVLVRKWRPVVVSKVFGKLQLVSAGYMGFSHGSNDAQKTMGIIALALVAATKAGSLDHAPAALAFLKLPSLGPNNDHIPAWIKVACALTMAAGTAAGGWRIIKTMGHRMVKLQTIHGFAAETTAATVLMSAQALGMPVSTTHAISTSIMGVGCAKRFSSLNLPVVHRILWAWVLTLPMTGLLGYVAMRFWIDLGWPLK